MQPKITYDISNNPLNIGHTKTIGCYSDTNKMPTKKQLIDFINDNLTTHNPPQALKFFIGKILNTPKVNISYIGTENNKSCGVLIHGSENKIYHGIFDKNKCNKKFANVMCSGPRGQCSEAIACCNSNNLSNIPCNGNNYIFSYINITTNSPKSIAIRKYCNTLKNNFCFELSPKDNTTTDQPINTTTYQPINTTTYQIISIPANYSLVNLLDFWYAYLLISHVLFSFF